MLAEFQEKFAAAVRGAYEIKEELGRGGMAIVYRARDRKHGRDVAVKVLRPELAVTIGGERFLREIEIAARLQHPHILPLFDSGSSDGFLYYVMPLALDVTLAQRLAVEKHLPIADAVRVTLDVAGALEYAHGLDIVHRDVKPDNILLSGGHAVVADFGIARMLGAVNPNELTGTGLSVGTPAYMSPEQAEGDVDARSDIYSLGCVLYEMLVGEPPFTGRTALAVMARHASEAVPSIRNVRDTVPESLEYVVCRAMAKMPADRFASAKEMADALNDIVTGQFVKPSLAATPSVRVVSREPPPATAVAVLPFANVGADPDLEYFSDGMTDELIGALTRVAGLRVASRTSVFAFKGKQASVQDIGRQLKVSAVLEGSIRWAGDTMRVTVELTNAGDGYNLWAQTYERKVEAVFSVQEEISQAIVDQLRVRLVTGTGIPLVKRYTDNVDAYKLYLQGRYFWNRRTPEGIQKAIEHFSNAIGLDPDYALAYSGLADAGIALSQFLYLPPGDVLPAAEEAARRAVELDEALAEAHVSLAHVNEVYHWRWDEADAGYRKALELNPEYATAHAWYADLLAATGRPAEALAAMDRAQVIEPLSVPISYQAAALRFRLRDYAHAVDRCRATLEMEPAYFPAHIVLGVSLIHVARSEEGLATLRRAADVVPGVSGILMALGYAYGMVGRRREAEEVAEALTAAATTRYVPAPYLGIVYASLGDADRAVPWIERGIEERSSIAMWLAVDPFWDKIRPDPRFADLLNRMSLPAGPATGADPASTAG